MTYDALDYPLSCIITGRERNNAPQGKALLVRYLKAKGYALLDVTYDGNGKRRFVEQQDATAVIAYEKVSNPDSRF